MAEEKESASGERSRPWLRRLRFALMILGPAILIAVGLWYYIAHKGYVSTDDAFVQANAVRVSPQVAGRIVAVPVHTNERVKKGSVLLRLDPAPYDAAWRAAEAKVAATADQVRATKAQYQALDAQVAGAQAQVAFLEREVHRQGPLAKKNVVTNAKLDELTTRLAQARQQVAALAAQRDQALAALGGDPDQPLAKNAGYRAALAALAQAKLNRSYTVVRAPADGIVGPVDVRPGDVLPAGGAAFPLVETAEVWIKANFKETALTHMHPGDPATVTVDSYPGRSWKAHVESISPASGEVYALLPPQNASGNWVKVVQRIPVRLAIEREANEPMLRAGMSAEVSVYVGGKSKKRPPSQ
ncbi:MAG TPA: HlyD family secretion protein [Gammaproteobacteria bacterium]|nr:HlyD family secretion protein [Gammaproteobacteria bacterium]